MDNNEIRKMLAFEEENGLRKVKILVAYEMTGGATFYRVLLTYLRDGRESHMLIPVIHYSNTDYLFVPWDWQGWLPSFPDDIGRIKWRATNNDREALIVAGLPTLSLVNGL